MFSSVKIIILVILCLQNTIYTLCRRYSLGVLNEQYNKYEVLLLAEGIKIIFSAVMIIQLPGYEKNTVSKFMYIVKKSWKMCVLACLYGAMNILSFVALRNIGAGMFTIFAQLKILSTAGFSAVILNRRYSMARWRALISLIFGVLLFSEPIWKNFSEFSTGFTNANPILGTICVLTEVMLSGFASIYFEKVIKSDAEQFGIWERNFQLALWSFPLYVGFIFLAPSSSHKIGAGWSVMAFSLSALGASGGLLVALSIKYGDSVLKTLATTSAIILSAICDHIWLGGPLTIVMCIAAAQVIISIANYAFDASPIDKPRTRSQENV